MIVPTNKAKGRSAAKGDRPALRCLEIQMRRGVENAHFGLAPFDARQVLLRVVVAVDEALAGREA